MSKTLHEKASEILAQVIDLPEGQAIAKIESLCDQDSELETHVKELFRSINEEASEKESTDNKKFTKRNIGEARFKTEIIGKWSKLFFENKKYRLLLLILLYLLLLVGGLFVRNGFNERIVYSTKEKLEAQLNAQSESLVQWMMREKSIAVGLSKSKDVVAFTCELDSLVNLDPSYGLIKEGIQIESIKQKLAKLRQRMNLEGVSVLHKRDPVLLATSETGKDGEDHSFQYLELNGIVFDYLRQAKKSGGVANFPPLPDYEIFAEIPEGLNTGTYLSYVSQIVKDSAVVGYFFTSYSAMNKFSDIIQSAQYGESNKVYAFSWDYKILSRPRFETTVHQRILEKFDQPKGMSINFEIKDPGGMIKEGDTSFVIPVVEQSHTAIIDDVEKDDALDQRSYHGALMKPYRDYRGVEVVGVWNWLPEVGFGMIAEIDVEEAFISLRYFDTVLILFYLILAILIAIIYQLNIRFVRFGKKIEGLKLLGHYELKEKLGEGGFGQVYKAHHQNLKSEVAIKLLKKELAHTDALDRFEKEVRITSNLSHPNTIKVFDFGTTDEGQFYYVMEYLNGISLEKVVASYGQFPVERCVYILLNICYSLQEAHFKNLVHRDIKPANIMLCNQGGFYDQVKVLDFGLVKDLDASETQQTQINRIGGTPMFMSPERLRDPFNADHRVDIYSIGALGLYLLSGQFVIELISQKMLRGDDTLTGDLTKSIFEREDVPQELRDILLQCVHFDMQKRPASMEVLIESFEQLASQYPWTRKMAKDWWNSYDVYQ